MKTKIQFRDAEGRFCKSNMNQIVEIEHDICSIAITRAGQQAPQYSNLVTVETRVTSKGNALTFDAYVFKLRLSNLDGFWQTAGMEKRLDVFFKNATYREAFSDAVNYVLDELKRYDTLVAEREEALVKAEF